MSAARIWMRRAFLLDRLGSDLVSIAVRTFLPPMVEEVKFLAMHPKKLVPAPGPGTEWDASHWSYVGEGNTNIVVRYAGPELWPFVFDGNRLALRIPKVDKKRASNVPPDEMIEKVWSQIFPYEQLPVLHKVRISCAHGIYGSGAQRYFLTELAARISIVRPAHRCRDMIDFDTEHIWVTRDESQGLVFEIKPKCGYLPSAETTNNPMKTRYSRYKIHKILSAAEVEQGKGRSHYHVPPISYAEWEACYDPLDLFSGDADRVQKAAVALVANWRAGGNNLRIFHNGKALEPDSGLARKLVGKDDGIIASRLAVVLKSTSMQDTLQLLKYWQAYFDPLGIEELERAWRKVLPGVPFGDNAWITESTVSEYAHLINEWKSRGPIFATTDLSSLRAQLRAHRLCATCKDLSIMITCAYDLSSWRLSFVDLDTKPVTKLAGYMQADKIESTLFLEWMQVHACLAP